MGSFYMRYNKEGFESESESKGEDQERELMCLNTSRDTMNTSQTADTFAFTVTAYHWL